jgi:hypothetical protein
MAQKSLVDVEVDEVEIETEKAIMVSDGYKNVWIPRSQIADTSEVQGKGDRGNLRIPEWLAKDKGLI